MRRVERGAARYPTPRAQLTRNGRGSGNAETLGGARRHAARRVLNGRACACRRRLQKQQAAPLAESTCPRDEAAASICSTFTRSRAARVRLSAALP